MRQLYGNLRRKSLIGFRKWCICTRSYVVDAEYRPVPHYKESSALCIADPEKSPFQKVISPDVEFDKLFEPENMQKSCLNVNLTARHFGLNLDKLKSDFLQVKNFETIIEHLEKQKEQISNRINQFVKENSSKSKKELTKTSHVKELIQNANQIKAEINKIEEKLMPIKNIVNTACLSLPNCLHFSSLYIHNYLQNQEKQTNNNGTVFTDLSQDMEDSSKPVLFEFNSDKLKNVQDNLSLLKSGSHWEYMVNDSIVIDSKLHSPKYAHNLSNNWSFIEQSSPDINTFYMTGTYAKLEQALVDFLNSKIDRLKSTNFENVKSVSMFKSAALEGCGQSFNDPFNLFHVVRFGGSGAAAKSSQKNKTHNIELLHLTGSASLHALVLNFIRTKIKPTHLPWLSYTYGKVYTPKKGQRTSFDMLVLCEHKSTLLFENDRSSEENLTEKNLNLIMKNGKMFLNKIKAELNQFLNIEINSEEVLRSQLSVEAQKEKNIDQIIIDLCKVFAHVYKDFNLPLRYVCLNPHELKQNESFKIEIQAYLPSQKNYLTVS
jgi:seryl-tRNA synthetase